MEKILLVSNEVFHYRIKIYNRFHDTFERDGYEFIVLADKYHKVDYDIRFEKHELVFSVKGYLNKIDEIEPQYVILFLHLKDMVMLPIINHCHKKGIPVIYWNHGINLMTPDNKIKNAIFHYIHSKCDALITYTPDMVKYFTPRCREKLFIAYNTLDFSDIDKDAVPSRQETRAEYGIKQGKVILYVSRMLPYKRADLLMEQFADIENIAVVLVGPGFTPEQQAFCDAHDNLYYLGEKYGAEVNAIFKMADVFSTPGHIGLSMNEALFWGLPVILLNGLHSPEIYYMKSGVNGYLAKDEDDFKCYMLGLLADDERLKEMSDAALEEYNKEVSIERMYQGFIEAINYCGEKKSK